MANAVVVKTRCASENVDAYNRVFVATEDVPNGGVFLSDTLSDKAGQGEVFKVKKATADTDKGVWMAYSPEIVSIVTATGQVYRGVDADPRNFTNIKNVPFDGFKPQVGDLIEITSAGISSGEPTKGQYVGIDPNKLILKNYAGVKKDGFCAQVIKVGTMTIANGKIASEGVKSFLLEVISN